MPEGESREVTSPSQLTRNKRAETRAHTAAQDEEIRKMKKIGVEHEEKRESWSLIYKQ